MILLDTHVTLWLRLSEPQLGVSARQEIDRAWRMEQVAVSAFSFWELAMLRDKGRLQFPENIYLWRREQLEQGIIEIAVDGLIGIRANSLKGFHADPADRIIVATALEGHRLVTADRLILNWPGELSRLDARE